MARLARLRAMGPGEVSGRVRARLVDAVERVREPGIAHRPEMLRRHLGPVLAESPTWQRDLLSQHRRRRTFFGNPDERGAMRGIVLQHYPDAWRRTCDEAARVRRGAFQFFGATFEYGDTVDWHADPVTGRRWPDVWHADVPLAGAGAAGDVKYVWELNRHQFLVDVAKRYWVAGDSADAAAVFATVRSWIAHNRYGRGVNWASPLEPAYRSLSWLWAYHWCLDAPALDPATHALWLAAFHDHARFLHGHLELYSSPFNHLIGEAAALFVLGVVFPEFHEAEAWRRRGRHVLETRLGAQFYADGGSVEQATLYHHATLGFYLLAALVGRAGGEELSPRVWSAIERACEFSMYLTQPDGCVPMIGDTDDARPIRLEHRPPWDFRTFLAAGAVLFGRSDFKRVARECPEEALWLLGARARDRFAGLRERLPRQTSVALRASGYYVLRSDWSRQADYVCVDCGEQAAGLRRDSIPSAAHGHADCLAVTVALGGQPVLVDGGFYTYNGDEAWERHFRETAAHNTARIDGADQARHLAKMSWCEVPTPSVHGWSADDEGAWVIGSHDGYAQRFGVVHRRTVWLRPGGYVVLFDEFLGDGVREHEVELNFQLAPAAALRLDPRGALTGDPFDLRWFATGPVRATLRHGGAGPADGWVAPGLGVRLEAPRLTLTATLRSAHEGFLTVLADVSAARGVHVSEAFEREAAGRVLCVAVRTPEGIDYVAAAAGRHASVGPFETDAALAVWRFRDGPGAGACAGGSYARVRSDAGAFRPPTAGV
jgi:hypothetical protein